VLDAAFAVFSERGIAGSSIAQVAEAAGLTKGAVYSNFASKDDLVLSLMEEHAMARLTGSLAELTDAPDQQSALLNAGMVLAKAMRADAAWHRILAEYFALSHHDPARREGLRRRRREARHTVARAITRLCEQTGLRLVLPHDDMATVLFALSNGLAVESGIDPDVVPEELFGRVLVLLAGPQD
jgi:AcrR family transcriptional regulator